MLFRSIAENYFLHVYIFWKYYLGFRYVITVGESKTFNLYHTLLKTNNGSQLTIKIKKPPIKIQSTAITFFSLSSTMAPPFPNSNFMTVDSPSLIFFQRPTWAKVPPKCSSTTGDKSHRSTIIKRVKEKFFKGRKKISTKISNRKGQSKKEG